MADPIIMAQQAWSRGLANEAERILETSLVDARHPDRPRQLIALAELYAAGYRLRKLEALAPELQKASGFENHAALMLMDNAARLGDRALLAARCRSLFPRRASLAPRELKHWFDYLVRAGCLAECREFVEEVENRSGRRQGLLRSAIAMEEHDYAAVDNALTEAILTRQPALSYRKGQALDRLGRYDEAFVHFGRGAAARKAMLKPTADDVAGAYARLLSDPLFERQVKTVQSTGSDPDIAFLFGFPRSGTTLLENVLDTHSGIRVMPERPALFFVKHAMNGVLGKRYPGDLANLDDAALERLRTVYLEKARDMGFDTGEGSLLIDKGPNHTVDIPLIRLLFPQARLILSLRHPLDVCLSCFEQDFEINANTRELIDLEDIVARYARIFSLLERYRDALGLDVLPVRYEDLVQDFDAQAGRVFDFLHVTPEAGYKDFARHATAKFVQSSSRGQVDQPLYRSAVDRWKNYRGHLEPHIPALRPFIEKFGYTL